MIRVYTEHYYTTRNDGALYKAVYCMQLIQSHTAVQHFTLDNKKAYFSSGFKIKGVQEKMRSPNYDPLTEFLEF